MRMRRRETLALCLAGLVACREPATGTTPIDTLAAKIPPQGTASTLDIGTWNIEWFGDPGNGPSDDSLQLGTAASAISAMDLDILGVQEIVSATHFAALDARLTHYTGVLASDPRVVGGSASYSPSEQKVGVLFKPAGVTLLGARIVLASASTQFAGRPPLELQFRVTTSATTRDLVVLVVHMKAFADVESWQRRADAASVLKDYLDTTWPTQQVAVIGDWNDDVDESIAPRLPTPYANFLSDIPRYAFPTAALSLSRVSTTVGFAEAIDHHLVTNELFATYAPGTARAVRLDRYISGYASITSDHFPVVTTYR